MAAPKVLLVFYSIILIISISILLVLLKSQRTLEDIPDSFLESHCSCKPELALLEVLATKWLLKIFCTLVIWIHLGADARYHILWTIHRATARKGQKSQPVLTSASRAPTHHTSAIKHHTASTQKLRREFQTAPPEAQLAPGGLEKNVLGIHFGVK